MSELALYHGIIRIVITTGQLSHSLVITNPDFFCHLTNKSHVVTNKHYAALEVINGVGESVNGLHVEMV